MRASTRVGGSLVANLVASLPLVAGEAPRPLDQYSHTAWQVEQGLPQNTVQAILHTRDGYLWVGTAEGLARFDGVNFATFTSAEAPALGTADIQFLEQDPDGGLWMAAYGTALVRFRGGVFERIATRAGASPTGLAAAAREASGALWFGGDDGSLLRYSGGVLEPIDVGRRLGSIRALRVDRQGRLWIGTLTGVGCRGPSGLRWFGRRDGLASEHVTTLAEDAAGQVWIGTAEGLYRSDGDAIHDERALFPDAVRALFAGLDEVLWVGGDRGLVRVRDGRASPRLAEPFLSDAAVRALAEDANGSLWVGTFGGGLNQLRLGAVTTYTRAHGLASDGVGSVEASRHGGVWVATAAGVVERLHAGGVQRVDPGPLGNVEVFALHEDARGGLWIGTERGAARLEGGRWRRLGAAEGVPAGSVAALSVDARGRLWVGYEGQGLAILDTSETRVLSRETGLPSDQVRALLAVPDGSVYVGTYGGLVHVDGERTRIYTVDDGLGSNLVRALHRDDAGALWIGTYGGGLSRLSAGRIATVTARGGLPSDVVYGVVDDDDGGLWMSCNRGIFSIRKADFEAVAAGRGERLSAHVYGRSDGMLSVECNGGAPAAARSSDGRLWFPTVRGVVALDPRAGRSRVPPPAPRWERVLVDGRPTDIGPLTLLPGARRVRFEFASPDFLAPERLRYEHRLEGFEEEWLGVPRRAAEYTSLPAGAYRFVVRVTDSSGQRGEIALPVTVRAAFYRTPAFGLASVAALALCGYAGYRLRVRALRASEAELRRRVEAALSDVRVLSGLLPICSSCKKIRDDRGYWGQIESYIREHSEAEFTHGICPDCAERLYPGLKATARGVPPSDAGQS